MIAAFTVHILLMNCHLISMGGTKASIHDKISKSYDCCVGIVQIAKVLQEKKKEKKKVKLQNFLL